MKHLAKNRTIQILLLSFFIFSFFSTHTARAQVTIGSYTQPSKGSLLELTEDIGTERLSHRGLGMPRVALSKLNSLEPCTTDSDDAKELHIGLFLYNISTRPTESLCPGLYVWDGTMWGRLHGSCEGFVIKENEQSCVRDGQQYSFKFGSFNNWTAEVVDNSGVFSSVDSPLSGNSVNNFDFKFTMNVNEVSDATAQIIFTSDIGHKETVTINAQKLTFRIPDNLVASVDGGTYDFTYDSNSSRPITISGIPTWASLDGTTNALTVEANNTNANRNATVTFTNGTVSKNVTISQQAITLGVNLNQFGFFQAGGTIPTPLIVTTNSLQPITVNSSESWVTVGKQGTNQFALTANANGLARRTSALTVSVGGKSVNVSVFQLAGAAVSLNYPELVDLSYGPYPQTAQCIATVQNGVNARYTGHSTISSSSVVQVSASGTTVTVSFTQGLGASAVTLNYEYTLPGGSKETISATIKTRYNEGG